MTKYGHYLAALDRDAPSGFRGKFIAYKSLKKCLKQCQVRANAAAVEKQSQTECSSQAVAGSTGRHKSCTAAAPCKAGGSALGSIKARFFGVLQEELAKVDRCFVSQAQSIVACFQRTEMRRSLACCFPGLLAAGPSKYTSLAERSYWCRKFARANAVALRKITKKYDKVVGGQGGRAFLQQCWRLPSGGAFLHSPLLDELKAIQDVLQEERIQRDDFALCEVADTSFKGASRAIAASKSMAAAVAGGGGHNTLGSAGVQQRPHHVLAPRNSCEVRGGERALWGNGALGGGVVESPTCMLSSSDGDFEWPVDSGAATGDGAGCGLPVATPLQHLHRPSLDGSTLTMSVGCELSTSFGPSFGPGFSPGTSPQGLSMGVAGSSSAAGRCALPIGVAATASGAADAPAASTPPPRPIVSRFEDEDLQCPICLDALYKPVGLTCGHHFCKQCSLEHARLGRSIGTFHNLSSYVAPTVACPQCRQPGVFKGAIRLRQMDRVVRSRFPVEWEERRQEERKSKRAVVEEASLRPALPINLRDALLTF